MPNKKTVISNARVFDGTGFTSPQTVYLEDGLIASISSQPENPENYKTAEVVDGRGKYLIPGYTDCHVHIRFKEELLAHAKHGVTTVLDMGCWPMTLANSFRNLEGYPDYLTAGPVALHPHGLHSHAGETGLPKDCTVDSEEAAVQFVKNRLADQTDFIKIVCEDGCPVGPPKRLAAEARAAGKISIAHAPSIETFAHAHETKANVLTHAPMDGVVETEFCKNVAEAGQIAVPTLVMMKIGIKKFGSLPMLLLMALLTIKTMLSSGVPFLKVMREIYAKIKAGLDINYSIESVRRMHEAGIPILTGTDSNMPPASGGPVAIPHGSSFQTELELLEKAGLSRLEILRAATSLPAKHFRLENRGCLEIGKRADVVLLGDDPLADIMNFARVEEVWCKGVRIQR